MSQFDFEFCNKRHGLNHLILSYFLAGLSNRQIARAISASESLVRARINKMARQGLFSHYQMTKSTRISEPVAFDGLENFACSQYEPNHINQAIGAKSLFIYDFNFAPLNRKGRMSDRQKLKNAEIAQEQGRFPKGAILRSSYAMFERLVAKRADALQPLRLFSDEHLQYARAVAKVHRKRGSTVLEHVTVSSKAARTYRNILFPVNHTDLLARQFVKAFARETISFAKTHIAMVLKYALFAVWKNYMRPQFTKVHKRNPLSNKRTPAQEAGVAASVLSFGDLFMERCLVKKHRVDHEDWSMFLNGTVPHPRRKKQGAKLAA